MGFFDRISEGLNRSRNKFKEQMNVLLKRGPELDEEFWELLEETLILSDIGARASFEIVENLRDQATRKALPDAYAVLNLLVDTVADTFTKAEENIFESLPQVVMFVGVNGSGKTTTVGKIAAEYKNAGKKVLMGGADTFRAAAMEQLEVWSQRADVEIVTRERGSDPASVCYETIERSEELESELVLIDTSGRLHTSNDLMRELQKIVKVVRKRSQVPVQTILVIDATTGQNGLQQAREFNKALDLDGLIVTKLDGTAKGGIALAISHELSLPIYKIGVGESAEDLQDFDAREFARAFLGEFAESEDIDMDRVGIAEASAENNAELSKQHVNEASKSEEVAESESIKEAQGVVESEQTSQSEKTDKATQDKKAIEVLEATETEEKLEVDNVSSDIEIIENSEDILHDSLLTQKSSLENESTSNEEKPEVSNELDTETGESSKNDDEKSGKDKQDKPSSEKPEETKKDNSLKSRFKRFFS